MQQAKVLETWVGVFVALGIVALFFMAMQVSNLGEIRTDAKNYRITARFSNAGSLKARAPVSMAGVRLGRVESIRFDKESYDAVVEMRIDAQYDSLPADTTASILTQGLLGEQYVGLTPGADSEYLKDGDELELTQSALVLEEVISRFLFNKAEGDGKPKGEGADAEDAKPVDVQPTAAIPSSTPAPHAKPPAKPAEGGGRANVHPKAEAKAGGPGKSDAKAGTPARKNAVKP
ncbi:outer membrane lipid asymmetry maintenance protein MlaD [Methyloterricola oryzae]|uniref:outer membrane lipid asymmetry maintenance protein MlaD n=1 Tax=Methyloterricola oryzae TaxID=1495050 RepID=UPI0009E1CBE9|nr:outer membrane lipid asymmetry maintenance protein MlaD [Methyloterricola oryzae]